MKPSTDLAAGPPAPPADTGAPETAELAVCGLDVEFGGPDRAMRRVVDGVSFSVRKGSFSALIGESGSGKSITCLATLGLVDPAARLSGHIVFEGVSIPAEDRAGLTRLRGSGIAMIFQDPVASLNPVRTIGAQLAETIRVHRPREGRAAARRLAADFLDKVGLDRPVQRLDQYPHELSGGMNQRVMIALALACGPRMLIADEPTTALDARIQRQVMDLIETLCRDDGLTVLLVSHDLRLVWDYAQSIAIMRHGRILEAGTPDDLSSRQELHPYARTLFKSAGIRP